MPGGSTTEFCIPNCSLQRKIENAFKTKGTAAILLSCGKVSKDGSIRQMSATERGDRAPSEMGTSTQPTNLQSSSSQQRILHDILTSSPNP